MNKYQEALDYLVSNGTHETLYSWGDEIEVETEHGGESLNLLQELVDKETPMKPKLKESDIWQSSMYCENCESFVGTKHLEHTHQGYCSSCGWKIDWSDERVEEKK